MNQQLNILMKNNILVKARYRLTATQYNLLIIILYELQKDGKRGMSCTINRLDFVNIISSNDKKTLKGIKDLLNSLMGEVIYFKEIKSNGKNSIWGRYNLISGFEYDDETEDFTIACSERVYDLLMSYLEIGYTPINVKNYLSLKNSYSKRMYDLLRLWSGTKTQITYSISELKELLMLENSYKLYSDFKRKVIDSAVSELNESNLFVITYTENKVSRKVDSITFTVKDLDKRVYFSEPSTSVSIPNGHVFTKGTLERFKSDFKEYDFNDAYAKKSLDQAVASILEKDNVDKIYNSGYEYFKATLIERLDYNMMCEIRELY